MLDIIKKKPKAQMGVQNEVIEKNGMNNNNNNGIRVVA